MKNLIIITTVLMSVSAGNILAENIYECTNGVIQNHPCKDNKGKLLNSLPAISKYNAAEVVADTDEIRARPNPKSFGELTVEDKKGEILDELTESAVSGRNSAELLSKSAKLKADLSSKAVSVQQAESESIRLQVLHNSLCSRRSATKNAAIEQDCSRALENIQAVAVLLQNLR